MLTLTEPPKRGSALPQAKLSEAIVRRVRKEYAARQQEIIEMRQEFSIAAFADHYGVSVNAMDRAIRGETWKHVR